MTKRARVTERFLCVTVIVACLAGCVAPQSGGTLTPAETDAIAQVSHVRRLLRAACGKLKDVNAVAADKTALMADARDLTANAVQDWGCFLQYWGGRVPAGYAAHPDWNAATRELTAGMAEMLRRIEEDDATNAFKACGSACGKFVALNEQARVRRTSDVLFSFRKAAKPLAEPVAAGDLDAVSAKVRQLTELRDRAMTEPVGGTGTPAQKEEALRAFSDAVDAFAMAAGGHEQEELATHYARMMSAMEAAYDLHL